MNVNKILNLITVEDIERAILSFDKSPYKREVVNDKYTLIHNEKEYPSRELIIRASNKKLKKC